MDNVHLDMIQNERLRDAINFGISWYLTFSGVRVHLVSSSNSGNQVFATVVGLVPPRGW